MFSRPTHVAANQSSDRAGLRDAGHFRVLVGCGEARWYGSGRRRDGCNRCRSPLDRRCRTAQIRIGGVRGDAQRSRTTRTLRGKGLMNRDIVPRTMACFSYMDEPDARSFWMRNTKIPLDIAFIDSETGHHEHSSKWSPRRMRTTTRTAPRCTPWRWTRAGSRRTESGSEIVWSSEPTSPTLVEPKGG